MLDSLLEKLGNALRDAESRKQFVLRIVGIVRKIFRFTTLLYISLLLILPIVAAWIGEKSITLAFLLYLPRVIVLLPILILLPAALIYSRKLAFLQLIAGLTFLTFGMGFKWSGRPDGEFTRTTKKSELIALTCNRGQHGNQSLQPFKNLTNPDIMALQETPGRAKYYLADANYSEFKYGTNIGEHTFLSRYPILSGNLVQLGADIQDNTPAARFVIDFHGQQVVVYSVHLVTVRDTLLYYRRGAFLYEILGIIPGTSFNSKKKVHQKFWRERIRTARALNKEFESETLPTLILGDFNAPAGGYIERLLTHGFQDSHQVAGSGCGYSFPGKTRNPLSLGGPWLRIDYILADEKWKVNACLTEEKRPSQHRAVATRLTLK